MTMNNIKEQRESTEDKNQENNQVNQSQIKHSFWYNLFHRIKPSEKIFFTQQLEIMVRTGFSLAQGLRTLAKQIENKRFKEITLNLSQQIEQGSTFAKSLNLYPAVFSEIYRSMIAAGESSGKLDEALKRLVIQMKKMYELKSKVKGAMIYPGIVLSAMLLIGTFMFIFVMPKIIDIYREADAKLPLPTRVVIAFTDFITQYGIFALIGLVVLLFVLFRFIKTKKGRRIYHQILLKLPIAKGIISKINIASFSRNLSSLLKTDIPIVETFLIVSRTQSNVLYQEQLEKAAYELKTGVAVTKILEKNPKLFPPVVTQIISVGEQTGTLDTTSEELAIFYEEELAQTFANLATIIEPVLMLILGLGVGVLAVAVVMPIYSLVQQF